MEQQAKIYVAGHTGMVGSAIWKNLQTQGYTNLLGKTMEELDLRDKQQVSRFFEQEHPRYVFLCAAKVGGIQANIKEPVEFLIHNLEIQINLLEQSYHFGVEKMLVLGSSCIYPTHCPQPMSEEMLLTGPLEQTNEGYALSKIVVLKLGEYYYKQYGFPVISIMPPNLYGPNDHFDIEKSHVLSALVKRFVDATAQGVEQITLWGTGESRREFMHVDDLAKAALFFFEKGTPGEFINVGWGTDISIKELAEIIAAKTQYNGKIVWDHTKPNGMLRKCMDVCKMQKFGFVPTITLEKGIEQMIEIYKHLEKESQ